MKKTASDSRRVGIFGASGSGKTTKALTLITGCKRLVVFDPLDDFGGKFTRFTDLARLRDYLVKNYAAGFRVAFVPPPGGEPDALSAVCMLLKNLQTGFKFNRYQTKITLLCDELNLSFPLGYSRGNPANGFCFLCNQGRHYGINVIGVSQRMSLVDMPFRANLSDLFVFRLADFNDIKAATAMLGAPYKPRILALQNYKYIYKNPEGVIK